MNILGWVLAVCGLAGLIFGLRMMVKSKKMGNVPFKKPSEIASQGAQAADAKGLVSTEGTAQLSVQPLIAPMSGQPCIGYAITVERKWEKHVTTEKGTERRTGSSKVHGEYRGSFFQIGDGQGAVLIDATSEPDSEYEKSHSSTVSVGMMIPGVLSFGGLQMNTPAILNHDERTTAFVGTEKILKPSPTMYALGQLAPGAQGLAVGTPKGIGTGKLIVHHQGREKLLGKTKRNMILGYALGGALFVGGVPLGLFGSHPQASASTVASCPDVLSGNTTCEDRMYAADGKDFTWTVTESATYSIELRQPAVANPIDGTLTVLDASGTQVAYDDGGSAGKNAHIVQAFTPGTYKVNVRDFGKSTVTGGYGFQLVVTMQGKAVAQAQVTSGKAATTPAVAAATPVSLPAHPLPPPKGAKPAHK